jgi:hypothetical protein
LRGVGASQSFRVPEVRGVDDVWSTHTHTQTHNHLCHLPTPWPYKTTPPNPVCFHRQLFARTHSPPKPHPHPHT